MYLQCKLIELIQFAAQRSVDFLSLIFVVFICVFSYTYTYISYICIFYFFYCACRPIVAGDDDVHIIMSMLINMYLNFAYISLHYACSSSRTTLRILDEFSIAAVAVTVDAAAAPPGNRKNKKCRK